MELFFKILVTIMGVLMSLGYYPQAYKLYKTKSSQDISLSTFVIFAVGTFVWTVYGFFQKDFTIILLFLIGVIGSWSVLYLTIRYRRVVKDKNATDISQG